MTGSTPSPIPPGGAIDRTPGRARWAAVWALRTLGRRLLLLWALLFWQGGFMFYGGVVVPIGSRLLGSDLEQGLITQVVTNALNLAGAVALALWAWDLVAEPGGTRTVRRLRGLLWGVLVLTLGLLVWTHLLLDRLLVPEELRILDRRRFALLHSVYITASTVQWAAAIPLSALTLHVWTAGAAATPAPDDRSRPGPHRDRPGLPHA